MAGITYLEAFQAPALRGLVEAIEEDNQPIEADFASEFMADENIYSTNFAYDVIKQSNNLAAMIGVGAEPPVVDRDEVASRMGELAKYGLKSIVTEEELLALNQPRNSAEQAAIVDKLLVKGADLVTALQKRVQISKAEAIAKGQINYNKNGVKVNIDYTTDMPDEHKVVLSGAGWADVDHDIIGDLMDWVEIYENNTGQSPDAILMPREIHALMLKNSTIVIEATGIDNSGRKRVSQDELNNVLSGYGLPTIKVITRRKASYKDQYTGDIETVEYFPEDRVVMVSKDVGKFLFGPTVENEFQPGIVLEAYDKNEPIQSIFRVAAAGFPIIEQPNLLFHADVVGGGVEG